MQGSETKITLILEVVRLSQRLLCLRPSKSWVCFTPFLLHVLISPTDSTQSGKPIAGPTNQLRKALGDKTPGTHLQNRGLKLVVQNPGGKTTILIEEKPPSASRKSVKRPRVSAGFKTPNPATQKPHWDVVDADVSEQIILKEEKEDDDEPEYMPPRVSSESIQPKNYGHT